MIYVHVSLEGSGYEIPPCICVHDDIKNLEAGYGSSVYICTIDTIEVSALGLVSDILEEQYIA